MRIRTLSLAAAAGLSLTLGSTAPASACPQGPPSGASHPTAVFHDIPGIPGSEVPGMPGVSFRRTAIGDTTFDRVYGSDNGNWIMTALADLPIDEDELLIVNGVPVIRQGQPAPWLGGSRECGAIGRRVSVNASGDFAFTTKAQAGPAADDRFIVTNIGGVWGYAAREGDPIPALPGNLYGDALDAPLITDAGTVGFWLRGTQGPLSPAADEMILLDDVILSQQGVTVPPGQSGLSAMKGHRQDSYFVSADGSRWIARGSLLGDLAVQGVLLVDGVVVLQDGTPVPGAGFTLPIRPSGIGGASLDPRGNWYAFGKNAGPGHAWVLRNGDLIAESEAPVTPGATERWRAPGNGSGFWIAVGNARGDHVVAGSTDAATYFDHVLVLNGTDVICRRSDPVDLDGDGVVDDAYINTFVGETAHLAGDGTLLVVATLRNNANGYLGQALLRIDTRARIGTNYCTAAVNSTGAPASIVATGSPSAAANDVTLTASDAPAGQFGIFLVSRTQGFTPVAAGHLCLGGAIGRYDRPGQIVGVDASGTFRLVLDLAATPEGGVLTPIGGGETWNFQGWFRDVDGAGATTANWTDGVSIDFR